MQLRTSRLHIRPFEAADTPAIHRILDLCFGDGTLVGDGEALRQRDSWVLWSSLTPIWHERLHQPPYEDMAVVHVQSGLLVGSVGYVPVLEPVEQLPGFGTAAAGTAAAAAAVGGGPALFSPEVGLFWAVDPDQQGQGYATEAATAMIDNAFERLQLKRIVAATDYDNLASQRVMVKAGMALHRNPLPTPSHLQVLAVRENPLAATNRTQV